MTGVVILARERGKLATEEADNLRATLDLETDDYSKAADLTMTICNFGNTSFWDVRVFRCADVVRPGESQGRWRWYVAELDYVDAKTTYSWTVEGDVMLGTGRAPHPRSFETFVHRGVAYARHRRRPLQSVERLGRARQLKRHVTEFEKQDELITLTYQGAKVSRRW